MTEPQTRNDPASVINAYRAALDSDPDDTVALMGLGRLLLEQGDRAQAARLFQRAAALSPDPKGAHAALKQITDWYLAQARAQATQGRMDHAEVLCRRAQEINPQNAGLNLTIGGLFYQHKKYDVALRAWHHAVQLDPRLIVAYLNIGKVFRERKQPKRAIAVYQRAIAANPEAVRAYQHLVPLLRSELRYDEALQMCERLRLLRPDDGNVIAEIAALLERQGDLTRAQATILPLVRKEDAPLAAAVVFGTICQRLTPPSDEALPMLERQLARDNISDEERSQVLRALASLCDVLGRCDEAFTYLEQAKALEMLRVEDSKESLLAVIARSHACYSSERLARLPRARHGSDRPVFIVGMPRTGTSLAEQILSCHPQIRGAGELTTMIAIARTAFGTQAPYPDCLDALTQERVDEAAARYLKQLRDLDPRARRVTDKMPFNFLHLGQIELLFPEARVIHCTRDPLDTCVSCYFMEFSPKLSIFQDLTTLGTYYRGYRQLMEHWERVLRLPIFTLRYETLLAEPEPVIRALVEFCGVEWDPACLRFYESKRPVKTFSYHQVRKPLYTQSIGRHEAYERYLDPLKTALADVTAPGARLQVSQ
jgi:tetratricopeptide (TPR) repeat protein